MSDILGPVALGKKDEAIFLGKELATHKNYSEKTAEIIDEEIGKIVLNAYESAKGILRSNIKLLHAMAEMLLEKETIESKDIEELIEKVNGEVQPA